ncbi:MAG: MFS transporter [Acidimicrobiales bacterium]|nr:MFS transporter [Acidimicrobiales bacterium]
MATAIQRTFGSLSNRNFRWFFGSSLVSYTGEWMQNMAEAWFVLNATDNGASVGGVFAFRFAPVLFFGLWGGVIADRFDRRRLMLITQSLAAALAFALYAIVEYGVAEVWMIYGLAFALGLVVVVDHPAHNAFIEEMVGPEQLPNAVALNSAVSNSARITGPAIAAILISQFGVAWVFFVNGITFIAVVFALLAMRRDELLPVHRSVERPRVREGLRYAWAIPEMRATIAMLFTVGLLVWNFPTFLTLVADRSFGGKAELAGFFMAVLGVGTLFGALAAAHRGRTSLRVVLAAGMALGMAMIATAAARNQALFVASLLPTGALAVFFGATANAHMQSLSTQSFRGRVMSIYSLLGMGTTVVGGPLVGWISQMWTPRVAIGFAGVATGATAILLTTSVRRRDARLVRPQPESVPRCATTTTRRPRTAAGDG